LRKHEGGKPVAGQPTAWIQQGADRKGFDIDSIAKRAKTTSEPVCGAPLDRRAGPVFAETDKGRNIILQCHRGASRQGWPGRQSDALADQGATGQVQVRLFLI
jgi:hypothetical protein